MKTHLKLSNWAAGAACLILSLNTTFAQTGINDWLDKKASDQVSATTSKSTPKQSQSISIDHGSTTLVDQSNGTDVLSTALSLVPVGSGSTNGQAGSGTVTASLYALYGLATKQDLLAPSVYNAHDGLRKLFFTIGHEQQNATMSTSTTSTSTPSGTIYGVQWTPFNRRDASYFANDKTVMDELAKIAQAHAAAKGSAVKHMVEALCSGLQEAALVTCITDLKTPDDVDKKIKTLPQDEQKNIAQISSDYLSAIQKGGADLLIAELVQKLKQRTQFSVNFQTIQRSGTSPSDYSGELIFDRGISKDWLFTLNGSYKYSNSPKVGADLRTERAALQISRNIVTVAGSHLRTPLQFNLSGEGLREEKAYHYRAQLQLVVPITTGVDLPLSFGYGDQTDVLRQQEKGVYGKFGFTFDLSKIVDSIKGQK